MALASRRFLAVVVCLATALAFNAPSSKVPPKPRKVARTHARAGAKAVRVSGGEAERRRLVRGYLSVAGGVCAHIMLGTMYCWGNYLSYVTPSLRFFDGVDRPGVTPDAVQVLPIMIVFQALALSLGAKLDKAWGARATTLIGCLVLIAGTWLSSYCTRLLPFILVYSVCGGAGAGIAYTAPMYAGGSWFPNSRGLINGLTLFGFGSGAFLFNKVATGLAEFSEDGNRMTLSVTPAATCCPLVSAGFSGGGATPGWLCVGVGPLAPCCIAAGPERWRTVTRVLEKAETR